MTLTNQEAELLHRARDVFTGGIHLRAHQAPVDEVKEPEAGEGSDGRAVDASVEADSGARAAEARTDDDTWSDDESRSVEGPADAPTIELLLAQSFADVDAPIGVFTWPAGAPFWSNAALERQLDACPAPERTLVAMLDEWSQAHFLVRALPEMLRHGSWHGRLGFTGAAGRSDAMLVTLVAHDNRQGVTDTFSLFAMPTTHLTPAAERLAPRLEEPTDDGTDQLVSALVQHVSDLILVTDPDGAITFASPAATVLLALPSLDEGEPPNLLELLHPDDRPDDLAAIARPAGEAALPPHPMRIRAGDGAWRDLAAVLTDLTAVPAIGGFVLNARDVTDAVRAESSITAKAYTDELTGLANRVRLLDRLEGIAGARPAGRYSMLVLGLDDLDRVDLEHGLDAIDIVLGATGQRLRDLTAEIGDDALAARLQGDEFAVLVPGIDDVADAVRLGDRVRNALREPVTLGAVSVSITASVGVATSGSIRPSDAFDEVLARADLAMREAVNRGRDRTNIYEPRLSQRQLHRRSIDQQLRRALDSDGLCVRLQPIVELSTGKVLAAEALLRVRGDDGELLSPGAFVEAAESSGLIARLGAAVLRATCEQVAVLPIDDPAFQVSVNVSPRQVAHPDFAHIVLTVLGQTGLGAGHLSLEITEGAFLGRDDASETNIIRLRDEGVRVGLDEFGGDTSLGYLRRFPLDFVKIDRSLIAGLGANYVDGTIVRATIELAHKLGLVTVAVGVETEEQQHRLEQLGCDRAQGYLFGAAVAPEDLPGLLAAHR